MDVTLGSLMHLNAINDISYNNIIYSNVVVNDQLFTFTNNMLFLSRNFDKIFPEYIVMSLINGETLLESLKMCIQNIYINLKIDDTTILNIPFSLLWNLNEPILSGNNLYLKIPFEIFFGCINLVGLYQNILLTIVNSDNLVNYVTNYSLSCKTYIGNVEYRRRNTDVSNNIVQQLTKLEVYVSLNNRDSLSDEFNIRINNFEGYSKGFFIESDNIDELYELKFMLNGQTRTNYNRFFILNKCVKINNNMIFYPFNSDISYNERTNNSYVGSLNLNRVSNGLLNLKFNTIRTSVKIYSLNLNIYNQRNGVCNLSFHTRTNNRIEDFNIHNSEIITQTNNNNNIYNLLINYIRNDISGNYVTSDISGNYLTNNMSANILPYNGRTIPIHRLIPEDRRICGIILEEINLGARYMSCRSCLNNFNSESLRTWLRDRTTCPTCRIEWVDYNVYINLNSISLTELV